MSFWKRLENRFSRWAIPNVTSVIIAGQVLLYVATYILAQQGRVFDLSKLALLPGAILEGEVWRLVTFIFFPPGQIPLFVIFYWLLLYTYGNSLEQLWGTTRYNLYLLVGILANVIASFIVWSLQGDLGLIGSQSFIIGTTRGLISATGLLYGTVFLAFARRFPNFTIRMYFILPIRIKWLGIIMALGYAYVFLRGDAMIRIIVLGAIFNYLLFFGREHWRELKQGQRRRTYQAKVKASTQKFQHQCVVCGLNSTDSPKTLFRYCSKCNGQQCYCPEHIQDHQHIVDEVEEFEDPALADST